MKAIVLSKFGPPEALQLREVDKPRPKDKEVLIKVRATSVTTADCELRSLNLPFALRLPIQLYLGLGRPQGAILGQELAGEIEAIGASVTRFKSGDPVFAWTGLRLGAYAEYACLPEGAVIGIKPSKLTYEEAAVLAIGGLEAAHFLRQGIIQRGQKVLINGAGGSIGTFAIQVAKYFGAVVTGVDSADKLDLLRSIGADQVIDYAQDDFTQSGEAYDVIFDVVGKSPFSRSLKSLKANGHYLLGNPGLSQRLRAQWTAPGSGKRVTPYSARAAGEIAADLDFITRLAAAGQIRSVIDRRYRLEQMAEAHRYVDTGRKKGNVVITVTPAS